MSKARTSTAQKAAATKSGSTKAAPVPPSASRRKGGQTTIPGSTTTQAPRVVSEIPLSEIRPDPLQPRKFFDVRDIVVTLTVRPDGTAVPGKGIREPIRIRKTRPNEVDAAETSEPTQASAPWTIIEGERRYRASHEAGLVTIPCLPPEELDGQELLAEQLGASVGKAPLRVLELVDGVERLVASKMSIEAIAERTGLGVRRVRRALRLAHLAPEVRAMLDAGQIAEAVALEIATIETHGEQIACLKELGAGEASAKRARSVAAGYHLSLLPERAGFDPMDARLAPMPCNRCPKNTTTQRELWADGADEEAGKCTDRTCYQSKQEQSQEMRADEARARGIRVIEGDAAKELYPQPWYGGPTDANYVELDAECLHATDGKRVSYRDLVGGIEPTAIVNVHGKTRELVRREDVAAALERKGLDKAAEHERAILAELAEDDDDDAAEDARQKEYERGNRVREETRKRTREAIVAFALDAKGKAWPRFIARLLVDGEAKYGDLERFARLMDIEVDEDADPEELAQMVGQWVEASERTEADLRRCIVELVLGRHGYDLTGPAKLAGVDREKIAEQVGSEVTS